ncbi:MAG: hypothetical protein M3164_04255 [Actinomycetota bacterium]|nr:hypothetical protein [Actinomycetota bacterium]
MGIETHELTLDAGRVRVSAELEMPERPKSPFVLLTHGAGGDRSTPGLRAMALGVASAGHPVVRADLPYRAAGRRSPPPAEKSVEGFKHLVMEARQQVGRGEVWIVGGRSYGGRVASLAVAAGLDAAGLILYSYPLHRPGSPQNPRVDHWPAIKVPCLFLQGTRDPFCDLRLLERNLESLGSRPTLRTVEGGDHSLSVASSHSPDGKAASEESVVRTLLPEIVEWLRHVEGATPRTS